LNHEQLIGRRILLEFNPVSNYEKVVDRLAKESIANFEPIFIFTSSSSPIYTHLTKQSAVNFVFLSTSASTSALTSDNEVIIPAKNTALILDALQKIFEDYVDTNVFLVFDQLSELINLVGFDKAYKFLLYVADILPQTKVTALFLLNTSAHEPQVVSRIRTLFSNQLAYDKNGLEIVKTS
jgi:hypothetical protein